MSSIKLYIGTELADFNEVFNVMYSIGDIRNVGFGSNNKSYTLNLPLTKTNKRLLKYINVPSGKSEVSSTARLYLNDLLIISGTPIILGYNYTFAKCIINSDDWMDTRKNLKMSDLDLSAYNHTLDNATVLASWSAAYPFYRYPLIDFGALVSGETGATANVQPNDLIPMFSIAQLMTEILKPYTISSSWLTSNFIKDLFILARESIAEDSFISGKGLSVAVTSDLNNKATGSSSTFLNVNLSKTLDFLTTTTDEAGAWVASYWTIPTTGTYRFKTTINTRNTAYGNSSLTITDEQLNLSIKKNGSIVAYNNSAAYAGIELINNITTVVDTGYMHFTAGDVITVAIAAYCYVTILSGTQTVSIYTSGTTSVLINYWNNANKYAGLSSTVTPSALMPDLSQLDFLAAIRDVFNLRFFFDKRNQVMYIEPWDQFLSATIIDLTSFIDFESIDVETISQYYSKYQTFKWKDDDSDFSYKKYLESYTSPGQKKVTLTSEFTKPGEDVREAAFSSIVRGYNGTLSHPDIARIYKDEILYGATVFDRLVNFNMRLVHWEGLASEFAWYYDKVAKTSYPKIKGLDFNDATNPIYANYWMKFIHYIDKGKLFTGRMKLKKNMLTEFMTVVNSATAEGYRPTYQISINGEKHSFLLQKITSDGISAEIELILKS